MQIKENSPIFSVDFNELLADDDVVLFSRENTKQNIFNNTVEINENMKVIIYMEDINNSNEEDKLVSSGYIIQNPIENHRVKWCCKMTTEIRYEREDKNDLLLLLESIA